MCAELNIFNGLLSNWVFWAVVICTAGAQVIIVQFGNGPASVRVANAAEVLRRSYSPRPPDSRSCNGLAALPLAPLVSSGVRSTCCSAASLMHRLPSPPRSHPECCRRSRAGPRRGEGASPYAHSAGGTLAAHSLPVPPRKSRSVGDIAPPKKVVAVNDAPEDVRRANAHAAWRRLRQRTSIIAMLRRKRT